MTEYDVERVARAIHDAMDLSDGLKLDLAMEGQWSNAARAAITALGDMRETLTSDVAIGEFIARWDDAADGVMMDADTAQALARSFKAMRDALKQIERAPAWGYPDKWETTPAEVRQLARAALGESDR